MNRRPLSGLGLVVVGDELLNGRRQDRHLVRTIALCAEWRVPLRYSLLLPDRMEILETQLRWAMAQPYPFFCCGGLGSTPDDLTRPAAARAAGLPLERHPEGVALLREQFGDQAVETRLRMVDFPRGARLVPNPVNRVPGFQLGDGYFLPGFPAMAGPMMRWVLETRYRPGEEQLRRSLLLPGAREADLVELMEAFIAAHPAVTFSSLPQFTETGTQVLLSVAGPVEPLEAACRDLAERLAAARVAFSEEPESVVEGRGEGAP